MRMKKFQDQTMFFRSLLFTSLCIITDMGKADAAIVSINTMTYVTYCLL